MEPWKDRFIKEYTELCERREKLWAMLHKWKTGELNFISKCPYWLIERQFEAMTAYKEILEARAYIEDIDIDNMTDYIPER